MKQPFFITGIDDVEKSKSNAFGAAATFFLVFIISVIYMIKEGRRLDRLTSASSTSRIPYDSPNGGDGIMRRGGDYSDNNVTGIMLAPLGDEQEFVFSGDLRVEHSDYHDDPLWENPLPTGRPYRDDPTFT